MNDIFDKAGEIMDEIANDPKYNGDTVATPDWIQKVIEDLQNFINRILEEISDFIERIVSYIAGLFPDGFFGEVDADGMKTLGIIIATVLGVALATVAVILLVKFIKKRGKAEKIEGSIGEEAASYGNDYDSPLRLAMEFRSNGDFRMSLRYVFIATLVLLSSEKLLILNKGKTNRMYQQEVGNHSENIEGIIKPVFDEFSAVWYGKSDIGDAKIELLMNVFAQTKEAVKKYTDEEKANSQQKEGEEAGNA